MVNTVVILGASFAGLHIAHALLKKNDKDVKVVLVSQTTHFFWNLATVRSIVPNTIATEDLFTPLADALARYPADAYELIIGSATQANFDAKTVSVSEATAPRTLIYDQLVLATGSRCASTDVPWKLVDDYKRTVSLLDATRDKVRTASHLVVAGAGATGVEIAAELGFEYGGGPGSVKGAPKKEVLLLCNGDAVLGGDSVAAAAANELKKLGVTVRTRAKVDDVRTLDDGKTEVLLQGGDVVVTDLYLPTMGLVPNSEYVDARYLTEHKTVDVDEFFRVKNTRDVWAAGDIVSKPKSGFMVTQKQAGSVAKNVDNAIKGKAPSVVSGMPIDLLAVATGRSRGVGRGGPIKMPSIFVWLAKGRTMAVEMMKGYATGSVA